MTSCKDAIKDIEVDGAVAAEMEDVRLCPISNMKPLIVKMDNALSTLKKCKHLRMSSNAIGKIEGVAGCDALQILSLGRNAIKKIEGLNEVADTLEQLWISYNQIGSFSGIEKLVNLQVLYASNNKINAWAEVERLQSLPKLRELNLVNNPLAKTYVRPLPHPPHAQQRQPVARPLSSGRDGRRPHNKSTRLSPRVYTSLNARVCPPTLFLSRPHRRRTATGGLRC